jgi:ATP synthase protein I
VNGDDKKLSDLQAQIDAMKAKTNPEPDKKAEANAEAMSLGMRAGTELVGTIGGSALIGYGLDRWLETKPWLLIVMLVLGTGAAFFNIYKTTQNGGSAVGFKKPPKT